MTITINDSAITTRIASLDELELLLLWAGDEGWNPGLDDAPLFHATDAGGFLVSTKDEHLVAGISLVKHTSCLLYTSPSPRDGLLSRMPSSA